MSTSAALGRNVSTFSLMCPGTAAATHARIVVWVVCCKHPLPRLRSSRPVGAPACTTDAQEFRVGVITSFAPDRRVMPACQDSPSRVGGLTRRVQERLSAANTASLRNGFRAATIENALGSVSSDRASTKAASASSPPRFPIWVAISARTQTDAFLGKRSQHRSKRSRTILLQQCLCSTTCKTGRSFNNLPAKR